MSTPTIHPHRIATEVQRHKDDMVALLSRLSLAESPSHDPSSQREVQKLLWLALDDCGFLIRRLEGRTTGGQLMAVPIWRTRGEPFQIMLGHCDTVWPLGTVATMPVEQIEGRLHGPGVYDMKAGLVQAITAVKALKNLGVPPLIAPVFFINSDEEIGSPESTASIRRLARRADRVFVMEPSLGPEGKLKTTRKGVGRFVIRVHGRAAHAGLAPEDGASAILELSHVVQKLFAMNDPQRGVTVNVGTIDGGLRPNVIAPQSTAQVDVRVASHADAIAIEKAIHALEPETPGTTLEISGRIGRPPLEQTAGNYRLWEAAQVAANELGFAVSEGMAGGGSDGNTTSLYAPTLDGLGAVGDGAHAVNEHVQIDSMVERASLLAKLLLLPPVKTNSN